MSAVETKPTVLYEAAGIQATREALKAARKRITNEGLAADRHLDTLCYGRLDEALDAAENALFNVLNLAKNLLDCHEAAAALERGDR